MFLESGPGGVLIRVVGFLIETDNQHFLDEGMAGQEILYFCQGDPGSALDRETIDPRTDGGEGDGFYALFFSERERVLIAAGQQRLFLIVSPSPNRPYRVYHPFCRQAVALGDFGLTRRATLEFSAFFQK